MNYQRTRNRYAQWLTNGTLFYLLFPFLLFLAGWIRSIYAIPACLLLLFCAYQVVKQTRSFDVAPPPIRYQVGVLLLAIYWCITAGLGEWLPQTTDFFKHNLIFGDLVRYDWPVRYDKPGNPFLCYYLAFYLPAALGGKLLGIQSVPLLSFLWSLGGLYIIFNWVLTIGGRYKLGALIGFTLLSGLHLIRFSIIKLFSLAPHIPYKTLPPLVAYAFPVKNWLYLPHQTLGCGLIIGWVYVELFERKRYDLLFFISSLSLFYSPFAAVGLAPLIIAGWPPHWRQFLSIPNLIGPPIIFFFLGSYYLAHSPLNASGWNIPLTGTKIALLINTLSTDVLFPFLIVYWLHYYYNALTKQQMVFIAIASGMKFLLAFYFIGFNNDFLMNVTLTMSSVFFILMGIALQQAGEVNTKRPSFKFTLIIVPLIIVCSLPLYMHLYVFINYSDIRQYASHSPTMARTAGYTINDLNTIMHYRFKPNESYDFSQQYLGSPNHFVNRYLLK